MKHTEDISKGSKLKLQTGTIYKQVVKIERKWFTLYMDNYF